MPVSDFLMAHAATALAVGGLAIGGAFGWTVYRTNFCVMGALSDIHNLGDWRRARAWMLAAVVAMMSVQMLANVGGLPLQRTMYLSPVLNWFGHALGGALFGFGMVLCGGCPTRNLVRFGSGDLRALVVLIVVAIAGFVTIGGVLAPVRDALEQVTALDLRRAGMTTQSFGSLIALTGMATAVRLDLVIAGCLAAAGLWFVFGDAAFVRSRVHVVSGLAVGLLVACGWALTGLTFDEFAKQPVAPISLTFIRPLGDTLDWLQRFTAIPWPGFGVSSVVGVLLGGCAAASAAGRFRVLGFVDAGDLKRNLSGAALMGVGGAMALGCTIGQGVTGVSTLAVGSFITTGALIFGGNWGLRYLERSL